MLKTEHGRLKMKLNKRKILYCGLKIAGLILVFNSSLFAYETSATITVSDSAGNPRGDTDFSLNVGNDYTSTNFRVNWDFSSSYRRSLVGVSISLPANSIVNLAYLYVFEQSGLDAISVTAYKVTSSWAVNTVAWGTQPSIGTSLATITTSANAWNSFNITSAVQSWNSSASSNYGILLKGPESGGTVAGFYSSNFSNSSYRPYFKIYYTPPPSVPTSPAFVNAEGGSYDYNGSYIFDWSSVTEADDYEVQENNVSIGNPTSSQWSISGKPNGTYCYKVRSRNAAGNSADTTQICVVVDLDLTNPTPPTICNAWDTSPTGINLSDKNNVWQSTTAAPYFEWDGATDNRGIAGYAVYFGNTDTDPGTTVTTANKNYDAGADPGANGTYYLNVRTIDLVGRYSPKATLFAVKYDGSAPNNPTTCSAWKTSSRTLTISSGVWQTDTANPYFEWNIPTDVGSSELAGYYYYYGTSISGEPTTWTSSNSYDAGADPGTPGMYYLRLKTKDKAGNVSVSSTVFVVKYDGAPTITDLAAKTDSAGAAISQGVWQADNSPYFYWTEPASASAIEGYSWAWNALPDDVADTPPGINIFYQTPDGGLSNSQHTFHIKAKNNIGWGVVSQFSISVDTTPPTTISSLNDGTGADTDITDSGTQLSANWSPSLDGDSGIAIYLYAIATSPGGTNIVDWRSNSYNMSFTHMGLALSAGTTYYVSVKARNEAGLDSVVAISDGILAAYPSPPSGLIATSHPLPEAEYCANTAVLSWTPGVDSDGVSGYYYIFNATATTVPTSVTGTFTSITSATVSIPYDGDNYFSVVTKDSLGNVGIQAASRKIRRKCQINPAVAATYVLPDGSILEFPIGALAASTTLQVRVPVSTEIPSGVYDPYFRVSSVVKDISLEDNTTLLNGNMTITLKYTNSDIAGLSEDTLKISYYDTTTQSWRILPNSVAYPSQKKVVASVDHLTLFAITGGVLGGGDAVVGLTNYPNPFTAGGGRTTKIRYTLRSDSVVELKIYDLLGKLVLAKKYATGESPGGLMGPNEIPWDGKNGKGDYVAAGGYICVVKSGDGKQKVKIGVK